MPGFNPEKINIHDLTVEEPEKQSEVSFDPEKDITPEQWQQIEKYFKDCREKEDFQKDGDYAVAGIRFLASSLTVLGHKPSLSQKDLGSLRRIIISRNVEDLESAYANMAILGCQPKKIPSHHAEEIRKRYSDGGMYRGRVARDIILMGRADLLPQNILGDLTELLVKLQETPYFMGGVQPDIRKTAVAIKLLGGNPVPLPEELEQIKHPMSEFFDKGEFGKGLAIAEDLAILSSDEAYVPEGGGLKLIRHKNQDLESYVPEMPEHRNF